MTPDQFWTSQDGQILTVKAKDEQTMALTPHSVRYTLSPRLQRPQFERMVSGDATGSRRSS